MQTLDRPTLLPPELSDPACSEQVIPGNVPPEEREGQVGGAGPEPEPLQGGKGSGDPEPDDETGNEGAGT